MTESSTRWSADDYQPTVTMSGAVKLADSQVAPLVAQARGYSTVDSDAGAKAFGKSQMTTSETKLIRHVQSLTKQGNDVLVIPWFNLADIARIGTAAMSPTTQMRPSSPIRNAEGKVAKYEFVPGQSTVIDTNPAVPVEWLEGTRFLITEGVLKADSALSAQMLSAGIPREKLAARVDRDTALRELQELLLEIPAEERMTILAIAGVGNWKQNPEWAQLRLRDRDVLVAFDGDLRTNVNVHKQAQSLWVFLENKHAHPKLVDLGGVEAEKQKAMVGLDPAEKLGIDDYLSKVGTWDQLQMLIDPGLPQEPKGKERSDWHAGDWRISEDGCSAEEYTVSQGALGPVAEWQRRANIGGRVVRTTSLRPLRDLTVRDGKTTSDRGDSAGEVSIEVKWRDEEGKEATREITGPTEILGAAPREWKKLGAIIDRDIFLHPEWPPPSTFGKNGWLQAIKANRISEQTVVDGWDVMGWVPTDSGHPAFIVGEQVLGMSEDDERATVPGVDDDNLALASEFGVNDDYWENFRADPTLGEYRSQLRGDIRTVVAAFLDEGPWKVPAIGATFLACMLRPTLPVPTNCTLYITGGPGTGKSWSAGFIMAGWQRRPGTWSEHHLPGQASDTEAAVRRALARTPIWVSDDLAPSASKAVSERNEASIDAAIRSTFNGAPKRRSNTGLGQAQIDTPRALQVITAENEREGVSIQQRMIHIVLRKSEVDHEAGTKLAALARSNENPIARVTAAMIRFWANVEFGSTDLYQSVQDRLATHSSPEAWSVKQETASMLVSEWRETIQDTLHHRHKIDSGQSARHAKLIGEMAATLDVLASLAVWAGIDPNDEMVERLRGDEEDGRHHVGSLVMFAKRNLASFARQTVGRNLLAALRDCLVTGKAHVSNAMLPGQPPVASSHPDSDALNHALGWDFDPNRGEGGSWIPKGANVGFFGTSAASADSLVLFNSQMAFHVAQSTFPNLVNAGQKPGATWSAVWTEDDGALIAPGYSQPGEGELSIKVRFSIPEGANEVVPTNVAKARPRGIPVKLEALIGDES